MCCKTTGFRALFLIFLVFWVSGKVFAASAPSPGLSASRAICKTVDPILGPQGVSNAFVTGEQVLDLAKLLKYTLNC